MTIRSGQRRGRAVPAAVTAALGAVTFAVAACSGSTGASAGASTGGAAGNSVGASVGFATTSASTQPSTLSSAPSAAPNRPGATTAGRPPVSASGVTVDPISRTVAPESVVTAPPVPISRAAILRHGVRMAIASVAVVRVKAHLPGEFSGPALSLKLTIGNHGSHTIDVGNVVVTVMSRSHPVDPVTTAPARPFHGIIRPQHSCSGLYVFSPAPAPGAPITVSARYTTSAPVVLFVGTVR